MVPELSDRILVFDGKRERGRGAAPGTKLVRVVQGRTALAARGNRGHGLHQGLRRLDSSGGQAAERARRTPQSSITETAVLAGVNFPWTDIG